MNDVTVAFIGDEFLVLQCAAAATAKGVSVALVASRRADIRDAAHADGIGTIDSTDQALLADALADRHVDVLFSIANERVIEAPVLDAVALGINFHDGPLPDYAGLGVTTWAIIEGQREHAVTWHTMTTEVDAGEVMVVERFQIDEDDTAFSLNARCYEHALATFPTVLDMVVRGDHSTIARPDRHARWFGRFDRPIVFVDPQIPADVLARAVRALDLGPRVRNRLGAVRWVLGSEVVMVTAAVAVPSCGLPTGSVQLEDHGLRLSTVDGDLLVKRATTAAGDDLDPSELCAIVGEHATPADRTLLALLQAADAELARHETFWINRLTSVAETEYAPPRDAADATSRTKAVAPAGATADLLIAAALLWRARATGRTQIDFAFTDDTIASDAAALAPLVAPPIGTVRCDADATVEQFAASVAAEIAELRTRGPYLADLIAREPRLRHRRLVPSLHVHLGAPSMAPPTPSLGVVVIAPDGNDIELETGPGAGELMAEQLATVTAAIVRGGTDLGGVSIVGPCELAQLDRVNDTTIDFDRTATLDSQFRAAAARFGDSPAVTSGATTLTFAELADHVGRFAARLTAAGAGPGSLVGIALERDVDLVVAVLGVLTVGAGYVPLDPTYPEERLRHMIDDSNLVVLASRPETAARIGAGDLAVVHPSQGHDRVEPTAQPSVHGPTDLAYVIYTSGSTGRPKGVMLEHRQVVNFFAAMDRIVDPKPRGTWLAVTSLSFDISVLELLWTLTRGFHVVLQRHGIGTLHTVGTERSDVRRSSRATSMSLFFFAAGDAQANERYRLLIESARFADEHGFEAIWLPERHFHAFGGAYPNPSVLAAAVAAVTTNVAVRAGSVVLPLHSSARVAEEWAVVDNLSAGRVGISFAPGWQPNDFVLNPTAYPTARQDLKSRIDEVRALWRGESVAMPGPDGEPVAVRTLPRPVQDDLPTWLTSAGTTATFEQAGTMGLNILTHLLGQSIEQLADNISAYRRAWNTAGHQGDGHVTVMIHTFLDESSTRARDLAEAPMRSYLASATGLLKNMASAFPTFAKAGASADEAFRSLTAGELDELLGVAARRYLETSGLFGDVATGSDIAVQLSRIGTDEIACLIDFGIDTDEVLASLPLLASVKERLRAATTDTAETEPDSELGDSVAELIDRHHVTHLQCTPSLAAILMTDDADRIALGSLRHMLVGGEALSEKLAVELRSALSGRLSNMYGPTETTIWSLTHELDAPPTGPVPIGRPIGNNTVYVLDSAGDRTPIGVFGELYIGGEGVARGYLGRPELTAERFVDRPDCGRVYATGDLARICDDGVVEFGGRVDFQVKIRGHRVELTEIESTIERQPSIERCVVAARGEAPNTRLVAFVVSPDELDVDQLRKHCSASLPDVMVPDVFVRLAALPLTPNGKVDRAALPQEVQQAAIELKVDEVPKEGHEQVVSEVWRSQLGVPVARHDNFFDRGGNSLLAVAVFRELQDATHLPIALTDVFRYSTIASFAAYLDQLGGSQSERSAAASPDSPQRSGVDRGTRRRQMLDRRRHAVDGENA